MGMIGPGGQSEQKTESFDAELRDISAKLAEQVREEKLSRASMLRSLRERFSEKSEDELTEFMRDALWRALGEWQ